MADDGGGVDVSGEISSLGGQRRESTGPESDTPRFASRAWISKGNFVR